MPSMTPTVVHTSVMQCVAVGLQRDRAVHCALADQHQPDDAG
jgi:hypothetical protein